MTKLITGGMGSIGAELARQLVQQGEDVVIFDVAARSDVIEDIKDSVKVVQGDLKIYSEVFNVVKENDVEDIFHLGAMLTGHSEAYPWASFQTNVVGAMHIFEAARLFGIKKVLFTSSVESFGTARKGRITDDNLQRPWSIYGCAKVYGEHVGRWYRDRFGLDFRSVRYPAVIAPRGAEYHHFCHVFTVPALGKPHEISVAEDRSVPVLYFKDAAGCLIQLYRTPSERIKTVNYNVVGPVENQTYKQMELAVKKYLPDARITFGEDTSKPQPEFTFDDSNARKEWKWQPTYDTIDKIAEDMIKEIRLHPNRYGLA